MEKMCKSANTLMSDGWYVRECRGARMGEKTSSTWFQSILYKLCALG